MPMPLWWRLWWVLADFAFGRSVESGSLLYVGAFGRNLASVAVKMFTHKCYFIKRFYKYCTFNAICRDNAEINCITVQRKKKVSFFSSALTTHTTLVLKYCLDELRLQRANEINVSAHRTVA
jgi:hypothetical protein